MSKTCQICDDYIDDNFYGGKFCDECEDIRLATGDKYGNV